MYSKMGLNTRCVREGVDKDGCYNSVPTLIYPRSISAFSGPCNTKGTTKLAPAKENLA